METEAEADRPFELPSPTPENVLYVQYVNGILEKAKGLMPKAEYRSVEGHVWRNYHRMEAFLRKCGWSEYELMATEWL